MEFPSLTSRAGAGEVKQEEVQVPLREQYGATAGHGWSPGPSSSGEHERRTRKEPYMYSQQTGKQPLRVVSPVPPGGRATPPTTTLGRKQGGYKCLSELNSLVVVIKVYTV